MLRHNPKKLFYPWPLKIHISHVGLCMCLCMCICPKTCLCFGPKKPIKVSSLASRHFMLGHGFPSLSLLANARSSHVLNDSSVLKSWHQIKFRSECPRYANVCLRMVIAIGSRSGIIRVSALVRFPSRRSDAANVRCTANAWCSST